MCSNNPLLLLNGPAAPVCLTVCARFCRRCAPPVPAESLVRSWNWSWPSRPLHTRNNSQGHVSSGSKNTSAKPKQKHRVQTAPTTTTTATASAEGSGPNRSQWGAVRGEVVSVRLFSGVHRRQGSPSGRRSGFTGQTAAESEGAAVAGRRHRRGGGPGVAPSPVHGGAPPPLPHVNAQTGTRSASLSPERRRQATGGQT